jgi:outer membrane receptor protein involved in Fe transport
MNITIHTKPALPETSRRKKDRLPYLMRHLPSIAVLLPLLLGPAYAQSQEPSSATATLAITGRVTDTSGSAVRHAMISPVSPGGASAPTKTVSTDNDGRFSLTLSTGLNRLHVEAPGFQATDIPITAIAIAPGQPLQITLEPAGPHETVEVSAYGAPLSEDNTPASTLIVTPEALQDTAGQSLDDKLRQVSGFELYRRTSSLVANPTSQGISLRGLGSTAASRTLVLSDQDPLNDPYGGWIHWDEIPELAIQSVTIVRGGASDLYGSSAIGGVIDLNAVRPKANTFQLNSSYGTFNTIDEAALATTHHGPWSGLATGGVLDTDGYTLVAPAVRGPVDVAYNVHSENGRIEADHSFLKTGNAFVRGNVLNEARANGTPLTSNGTRLWRGESGADWANDSGGSLLVRLHGTSEHFRQTFSSVAVGRASESLTRFVETPATELGGAVRWTQIIRPDLLVLGGADTRDVRAVDNEVGFTRGLVSSTKNITDRQRQTGLYGEVLYTPSKWTISLGGRIDFFRNFDAYQYAPTPGPEPNINQNVFDPRIGVLRHLNSSLALTATAFRAFRAPTQNELYRTGQVGQSTTNANPDLLSERATGWETGFILSPSHDVPAIRASYFWTVVNRPITALTLSSSATAITLKRENLGQIRSQGISIDADAHPLHWLTATGGYQFADATVTQFAPQPSLVGTWIPEVAHNMGTAQLQAADSKLGLLRLEGQVSGHVFDSNGNTYRLSGYFELNAYASHDFHHGVELYGEGQNLMDRTIQAGRTPVLTLASPRTATIGLRWRVGE